jgi:hypothetical protein
MNKEQIINGIIRYFDCEIVPKVPTFIQWGGGAALYVAMKKVDVVFEKISTNEMAKAFEIVDEGGNINIDYVAEAFVDSARKYGKLLFNKIPGGSLAFSDQDVILLKQYIKGER